MSDYSDRRRGGGFNKREDAQDIIYGVRAVIEAVKDQRPINKIFIQKGMNKELFYELKDALADKKYNLQFVPQQKLNKFTRKNHQGVVAQVSPVPYQKIEPIIEKIYEEGDIPLILILDGLTDVRNFGAIARTAECHGVNAIVIPNKDSVSITSDAIKTSAGALGRIPVCQTHDISSVIHYLKEFGIQMVAATEKAQKTTTQIDFSLPTGIVMGSEDKGVSNKILGLCEEKCKIPMAGTIASLNVSVAAGIMMYEALRQRV